MDYKVRNKESSHAVCEEIKLKKKGNQKSHKYYVNKLAYTLFHKRTIAPHGQKAYEIYRSNTKQSTQTFIIHYRKSQTRMIASVFLSVISSIKQENRFTESKSIKLKAK